MDTNKLPIIQLNECSSRKSMISSSALKLLTVPNDKYDFIKTKKLSIKLNNVTINSISNFRMFRDSWWLSLSTNWRI